MCCIEARGENYVFLFAANPSGSRLGHIFCTGGKVNASWDRNASRQYTKTSLWAFFYILSNHREKKTLYTQ